MRETLSTKWRPALHTASMPIRMFAAGAKWKPR